LTIKSIRVIPFLMEKKKIVTPEFQAMLDKWLLDVKTLCEKPKDELPKGVTHLPSVGGRTVTDTRYVGVDTDVVFSTHGGETSTSVHKMNTDSGQDNIEFYISHTRKTIKGNEVESILIERKTTQESIQTDKDGNKYMADVELYFEIKDGVIRDESNYCKITNKDISADDNVSHNQTVGDKNFGYLETAIMKGTRMTREVSQEKTVDIQI